MSDEAHPRVLYVGNLDAACTEDLLLALFGTFGACKSCKIIHEAGSDLYAFVEFSQHTEAQMALMAMNKRTVLGREMKVNWATSPGSNNKMDTSKHYHVFVGDLSGDVESHQLREAFAPFGAISDCKVIRDPQTHQSKGYAFVCFIRKEDAELAIASMNGQWLGGRAIRTNWANGKANANTPSQRSSQRELNYDEVYKQSSETNCTVYCGGIQTDLSEQLVRSIFSEFGTVQDVRVFKDKGFAFIRMESKDAATRAICATHGTQISGYTAKCSWGKEGDFSSMPQQKQSTPSSQLPQQPGPQQGYYGQMGGYWGYPGYQGYGQYPPMPPGAGAYPAYGQQGYGGGYGGYYGSAGQAPPNGNGGQWQPPPPPSSKSHQYSGQ